MQKFVKTFQILRKPYDIADLLVDAACLYHKPLRGQQTISAFPELVRSEVDGVLHYHQGIGPKEMMLPSVLDDVRKSAHGIPFNPTAQTLKICDLQFVRMSKTKASTFEAAIKARRGTWSTKNDKEIVLHVRGLSCVCRNQGSR